MTVRSVMIPNVVTHTAVTALQDPVEKHSKPGVSSEVAGR